MPGCEKQGKRSFLNAFKLQKLGIETPEPWPARIPQPFRLPYPSYYISLIRNMPSPWPGSLDKNGRQRRDSATLRTLPGSNSTSRVKHLDLGQGNVLVRPHTEKWHFSLVDINRMKFNQKGLRHRGFSNLRRLNASPIEMAMLASYYAEARQSNPLWGIIQLGWYKLRFQKLRNLRKSITRPLKNMAFAS